MTTTDDSQEEQTRYSIGELAELGGVSRRTVRYYVQRGLLPAPTGLGRGRHYTRRHLDTLIRVRQLQEAGHGLASIAERLAGSAAEPELRDPPPIVRPTPSPLGSSRWTRLEIADGVELHLRDRRIGPRLARSLGEAILGVIRQGDQR